MLEKIWYQYSTDVLAEQYEHQKSEFSKTYGDYYDAWFEYKKIQEKLKNMVKSNEKLRKYMRENRQYDPEIVKPIDSKITITSS